MRCAVKMKRELPSVAVVVSLCVTITASSLAAPIEERTDRMRTGVFPFYDYAKRYDVWEFTPMDQGGRLVQLQVVGSERDADIVKAIRAPGFFSPWGKPIRWDSLEDTELEKSVWVNRWYFLPSFARQYYLSGDPAYLHEIMVFVRKWRDENPLPADLASYLNSKHRNWRDMQVAWRTQCLSWCYFLGEKGFTDGEKRELIDLVEMHAQVLLEDFGKMPLNENNHQSHGATTMLYAALLFPGIRDAAKLRTTAFEILTHHLDKAFYDDGNSVELCPGYYPFFASIFRDAYLLCRANGITPPPRNEERLKQFYHFIGTVMQPNGKMPPINDSSESEASVSLQVLADICGLPYPYPNSGSHLFPDSQQAVMRETNSVAPTYVFLDAGPRIAAHWHGGKLGFHLWYWDKPLMLDSGIGNYDDPLKKSWYVQPEAHNTLLVDGKGDFVRGDSSNAQQRMAGSRIAHWESTANYDWAVMEHAGFQERPQPVSWVRHFVLLKGIGTLVVDRIESVGEHDYALLFHLPPCSPQTTLAAGEQSCVFTAFPEKNLLFVAAPTAATLKTTEGVINRQSRNYPAPVVRCETRARNFTQAFLLLPVVGAERPPVQMEQSVADGEIVVKLTGAWGTRQVEFSPNNPAVGAGYKLRIESAAAAPATH